MNGRHLLSEEAFLRYVQDGCKEPENYQIGEGDESELKKHIDERLAAYQAERVETQRKSEGQDEVDDSLDSFERRKSPST